MSLMTLSHGESESQRQSQRLGGSGGMLLDMLYNAFDDSLGESESQRQSQRLGGSGGMLLDMLYNAVDDSLAWRV